MRKVGGQGLPGGVRVGGGAGRLPPRSTAFIVPNPPTDLHRIFGFRTEEWRAGDESDGLRRDDRPGRPLRLHLFSAAERYPVDFFPGWPAPDPAGSVKNPGTRTASADSSRRRKAARPAGRAAIRLASSRMIGPLNVYTALQASATTDRCWRRSVQTRFDVACRAHGSP